MSIFLRLQKFKGDFNIVHISQETSALEDFPFLPTVTMNEKN